MENTKIEAGRLAREYDEFYARGDFNYYSPRISRNVIHAVMKKAGVGPGARVLDLGCGTGYYSTILDALAYEVTGIDISPEAIGKASRRGSRCTFLTGDAWNLQFPPESFDCILLSGCSLLNTTDIDSIRELLTRVLRFVAPGGKVIAIHGGDLTGKQWTADSTYNHTWRELHDMLPRSGGVKAEVFLSHYRLVALFGTRGMNAFFTKCVSFAFPKLYRHIFLNLEKSM